MTTTTDPMPSDRVPIFVTNTFGQPDQLCCNARDLYARLKVGRDFSHWIKDRIEQLGLIEGKDYSLKHRKNGGGRGRPRTDYYVPLEVAQKLAFAEKNEAGWEMGRYLAFAEKRFAELMLNSEERENMEISPEPADLGGDRPQGGAATTALVPVFAGTISGQPAQLCNARDLHAFLCVGDRFDQWIRRRIEEYGFADNEDFCTKLCKTRGRPATDYHLTLDMAKELAMVENNERGREVRRYFIAIEKAAHANSVAENATMTASLTLGNTEVRQLDGLYSLNDLHVAADHDKNHQPTNFLQLDTTQAQIAEIQSAGMQTAFKSINGGPHRGTYVCRELVYAYAMWISAKFYLQVIRAFDALVTEKTGGAGVEPPPPKFSGELYPHIARTAHAVALRQYDAIHDALTACVIDASSDVDESAMFDYVEACAEALAANLEQSIMAAAMAVAVIGRAGRRSPRCR